MWDRFRQVRIRHAIIGSLQGTQLPLAYLQIS